jgi:hypothetical protein
MEGEAMILNVCSGALSGMLAWIFLASLESPSFYGIAVAIFHETSPKNLYAMPAYYCIHRTILLILCAVGGVIGIWFSGLRWTKGILFLSAVLLAVAVGAAIFPR